MIEVKNKVVFLRRSEVVMGKELQMSTNIQGQLKKKVTRVKKLKIKDKVSVELTGNYKEFDIKIDPADSKHAERIRAMLKIKR